MVTGSVKNKMLKNKLCFVFALAFIDSSWVGALPTHVPIDGYSDDAHPTDFKVLKCPENEFLNHEGKSCESTCEAPTRSDSCTEKKIIACECNDGYLRNATGTCIKHDECVHKMPPNTGNSLFGSGSNDNGIIVDTIIPSTTDSTSNDTTIGASTPENNNGDEQLYDDYDEISIQVDGYNLADLDELMRMNSEEYFKYQKNHIYQYLSRDENKIKKNVSDNAQLNKIFEEFYNSDHFEHENNNDNESNDMLDWKFIIY